MHMYFSQLKEMMVYSIHEADTLCFRYLGMSLRSFSFIMKEIKVVLVLSFILIHAFCVTSFLAGGPNE